MYSTASREPLKQLLKDTMARFPHMTFPPEFQKATLEDWAEASRYAGLERFSAGVKASRNGDFFPNLDMIHARMPEPRRTDGEKAVRDLREWQARQKAGEKFYTLGDVLVEFCRKVEAGEFKSANEEQQARLMVFAKKIGKDAKAYAEKMLEGM